MNVFITGGSSGLGLTLAKLYLADGHRVGICDLDGESYKKVYKEGEISFYQVNVVDRDRICNAVADFASDGGLDLIIANAGLATGVKSTIPDFDKGRAIIDVNLTGVWNTFEAASKIMLPQKKGHLVAISSLAALNGFPGTAIYSATKAAVKVLCESLHVDLRHSGIDVSAICPGFLQTPFTDINAHPMPFRLPIEKAAKMIKRGIEKKKIAYLLPWQMATIATILHTIPRSWYAWLMRSKLFNFSSSS